MTILTNLKPRLTMLAALTLSGSMVFLSTGCGEPDDQDTRVQGTVQLPTDSTLNFRCADEGLYLETCVLDNPENPYANVAIQSNPDDPDNPNDKFVLNDSAPSAKARYYVWATALAKGAGIPGENQYYTALSLQEVFAESGSPTTKEQSKRAYRVMLDNYFFNPTFFGPFLAGSEEVFFAAALKDLVGLNLVEPLPPLISMYINNVEALAELSEWGYIYNETTQVVTFFR